MTHYQRLEFTITTGNVPQGNAGSGSRIYCGIGGREFRLDRQGLSDFGQGTTETIVAGAPGSPGVNIANPAENDPSNPMGELIFLPNVLAPGGTRPQPVYIRYEPKDQQKGWQLENATVKVIKPSGGSGFPPAPNDFYLYRIIGGVTNNRWLGDKFEKAVGLAL
jgi:hypothetical protein